MPSRMPSRTQIATDDAPRNPGFGAPHWPSDLVAFWMFATAHVLIWVLVPTLTEPNLSLDALEMISWGREWQLGYHKHPPLPAWIAETSCLVLGNTPWGIYLAAQLCVVACLWSAWQLGRQFLQPWHAVCAALMLEASYYYTFTTPELNNNVVSRAFWGLAIVALFRALSSNRRWIWAAAGFCLGLGLLSKYDTAILAIVMLVFGWGHPEARQRWRSVGPWLMLASALLTVLPHFVWLWSHDFPTVAYALRRSVSDVTTGGVEGQALQPDKLFSIETFARHLWNPIEFLLRQIPAVLPTTLMAATLVAFPLRLKAWKREESLQRCYLMAMVLGPLALILFISLVTGIRMRSMWGSALWTFTGVALLSQFELREDWIVIRRTLSGCLTISIVMSIALAIRNVASPHFQLRGSRIHFPGRALANVVEQSWNQRGYGPLQTVGGTWWTAGNVGFYGRHRYSIYGSLSPRQSPWLANSDFQRTGGVIVWQIGKELDYDAQNLLRQFPDLEMCPPISIPWATSAKLEPLKFGMAIVPPIELARQNRQPDRSEPRHTERSIETATQPSSTSH